MEYDVVILPGGHDKGVKQIIENESLRVHLAEFFPLTKDASCNAHGKKKLCGAIWWVRW
jgi:metallophosphoesterase superfamily enzyme